MNCLEMDPRVSMMALRHDMRAGRHGAAEQDMKHAVNRVGLGVLEGMLGATLHSNARTGLPTRVWRPT